MSSTATTHLAEGGQALGRYRDLVESTLATAVAAHNAGELAAQLQYALDYRVIIERGVGYLMARDQVDSMVAFNKLRRAARDTQSKIGDVAQRLVSTGRLPTEAVRDHSSSHVASGSDSCRIAADARSRSGQDG